MFNLPDGFTVNSAQANIIDNQWLGPTLAVPEPGSGVLLALGCGAIGLLRRRVMGHAQVKGI